MTDEALLRAAREGDENAFQLLYLRYRDPLYRFGCRLTGSPSISEDLVHDCFLGLLKTQNRFTAERGSLRTYVFAAVRNLSRKHFRDSDREDAADCLTDFADDHAEHHLEFLITEEIGQQVQQAVAELPLAQREVLVMAEYEEMSMNEIAEIVGCETNAVKARLHRARQTLRKRLNGIGRPCAKAMNHHG